MKQNAIVMNLSLTKSRGSRSWVGIYIKKNVAVRSLVMSEFLEFCSGYGMFCVAKTWVVRT